MAVSYGPKGEQYKRAEDQLTSAVAVTPFKEDDFAIDCDGCTACCKGHDGPIILTEEQSDYQCHKDSKGQWRLDQTEEGQCVYLGDRGCSIHGTSEEWGEGTDPADNLDGPTQPPRICRDFDCRSVIIKFNNRGLDQMVRAKQLPLDVVIQGRKKLAEFNNMINVRAVSGGADLSGLMEAGDAPDDTP